MDKMSVDKPLLLEMYRLLVLHRRLEEKLIELYYKGKIPHALYLGRGEEAIGVGAYLALRQDDIVFPHHRGEPDTLYEIRGVPLKKVMKRWLGKCRVEGSSEVDWPFRARFSSLQANVLFQASTVIGAQLALAAGVAMAIDFRRGDQIVLASFGEGSQNRGNYHEAFNFAAVYKLRVIFLCHNNVYAQSMPVSKAMLIPNVADRAAAYGFPGVVVDGNDPVAVYEAVRHAAQRARQGLGPSLVEAKTYRLSVHCGPEKDDGYRPAGEREKWDNEEMDPIVRMRRRLKGVGVSSQVIEEIHAGVTSSIDEAVQSVEKGHPVDLDELLLRQEQIYAEIYGGVPS